MMKDQTALQTGHDLSATLDDFLVHITAYRRCSPNTATAYRTDGQQFVTWCRQQAPVVETEGLTRQVLSRYLDNLSNLSGNSVRRKVHALGSWFKFLMSQGLIETNPAEGLPLPVRQRKLPNYPSPDDCNLLLRAARTPLEKVVGWLLATTGLRRGELVGLDLGDVSDELDEIRVRGKCNRERLIPLPRDTQAVLRAYLQVRGGSRGPLLLNRAGRRIGLTTIHRLFRRLLRRAGLQDAGFTLHGMRHGYATMLVKAGVDLATVRDLLGHSDVSVTSLYVHSDLRSKRAAVEHLPILGKGGEVSG